MLAITLAKTPACFAAPVPATLGNGQRPDCAKAEPVGARPQGKADESGSTRQVVTWVVGGVGVAALTTGIVYQLQAHSNNQKAAELCRVGVNADSCATFVEHERHDDLVSAAQLDRQIGFVALGVGAAALVTTAVLLITQPGQEPSDDAPQVSVRMGDGGWGAALSGRF